jgi:hypothetical protein
METLKNTDAVTDYGQADRFPVFGKKRQIETRG